jgi:hypothetical protein
LVRGELVDRIQITEYLIDTHEPRRHTSAPVSSEKPAIRVHPDQAGFFLVLDFLQTLPPMYILHCSVGTRDQVDKPSAR